MSTETQGMNYPAKPTLHLASTQRSEESGVVYLSESAQALEVDGYSLHRWLWHNDDTDARDLYRGLHRAAVRILERSGFQEQDSGDPRVGLYLDADDRTEVDVYVVGIDDAIILEATLYPFEMQVV